LQFHHDHPEPVHAVALIGTPGIPDNKALSFIYIELVTANKLVAVNGQIGHGFSPNGQEGFATLYQLP
jgi:hypothetical protein